MFARYAFKEWVSTLLTTAMLVAACCISGVWYLSILPIGVCLFILYFYRDPERKPPPQRNVAVSPADGKISSIHEIEHYEPFDGPAVCIRIFLNVFNVHVNRAPMHARVTAVTPKAGKYMNAANPQSAEDNASNLIVLTHPVHGHPVAAVRQVAGLLARTIYCAVKPEMMIQRSQRIGMIKLGSTTELYLPKDLLETVEVREGQIVIGGQTVLAKVNNPKREDPSSRTLADIAQAHINANAKLYAEKRAAEKERTTQINIKGRDAVEAEDKAEPTTHVTPDTTSETSATEAPAQSVPPETSDDADLNSLVLEPNTETSAEPDTSPETSTAQDTSPEDTDAPEAPVEAEQQSFTSQATVTSPASYPDTQEDAPVVDPLRNQNLFDDLPDVSDFDAIAGEAQAEQATSQDAAEAKDDDNDDDHRAILDAYDDAQEEADACEDSNKDFAEHAVDMMDSGDPSGALDSTPCAERMDAEMAIAGTDLKLMPPDMGEETDDLAAGLAALRPESEIDPDELAAAPTIDEDPNAPIPTPELDDDLAEELSALRPEATATPEVSAEVEAAETAEPDAPEAPVAETPTHTPRLEADAKVEFTPVQGAPEEERLADADISLDDMPSMEDDDDDDFAGFATSRPDIDIDDDEWGVADDDGDADNSEEDRDTQTRLF